MNTHDFITEYQKGVSIMDIAKRHHVGYRRVIRALADAGVQRRPPRGRGFAAYPHNAKRASGSENSQYRAVPLGELAAGYGQGLSTTALASRFGLSHTTVARKLRGAGVEVRRAGFGRYRECSDGHRVQSYWEELVDEWLTGRGVSHEVHPQCPWEPAGKRSSARADFLANGFYVEVWGVEGSAAYENKRRRKVARYRECGAKLIEIFPLHLREKDLSPLSVLLP